MYDYDPGNIHVTHTYMYRIVKLKLTLTFDQFYRKLKENKHNNNNKDEIMGRIRRISSII